MIDNTEGKIVESKKNVEYMRLLVSSDEFQMEREIELMWGKFKIVVNSAMRVYGRVSVEGGGLWGMLDGEMTK